MHSDLMTYSFAEKEKAKLVCTELNLNVCSRSPIYTSVRSPHNVDNLAVGFSGRLCRMRMSSIT
jgi:formate dehydrogenase assembly factor FdhD